jgi:hypothetical protein
MKKQIIIGSIMALSASLSAQWSTSGSDIYNTTSPSDVGINTTNPSYALDVVSSVHDNGIRITNGQEGGTRGNIGLHLNNVSPNGHRWTLFSLGVDDPWGGAGNFAIYDNNVPAGTLPRLFISGGNTGNATAGYIGVGTTMPLAPLHAIGTSRGLRADATHTGAAYAIQGLANGVGGNGQAIGTYGAAGYGASNFGIYGVGSGNTGGYAIGVYGVVTNGTAGSDWAGYFNGNVYRSGTDNFTSDRKLKNDIKPLANVLEKIAQLKPSSYTFKTEEFKAMALPGGKQMGLIAQDLEQVFPELVTDMAEMKVMDEKGGTVTIPAFKSVQYISLIPVLIAGMQEQQKQIEKQNELISQLSKTGTATSVNTTNTGLDGFTLEQNIPNPFSQETVISYNLPQQVHSASLVVYDLSGKQIVSFPIEKGASSITITSEKLAAGIYIYSVMADGKILDSKRMVVAQKQ